MVEFTVTTQNDLLEQPSTVYQKPLLEELFRLVCKNIDIVDRKLYLEESCISYNDEEVYFDLRFLEDKKPPCLVLSCSFKRDSLGPINDEALQEILHFINANIKIGKAYLGPDGDLYCQVEHYVYASTKLPILLRFLQEIAWTLIDDLFHALREHKVTSVISPSSEAN